MTFQELRSLLHFLDHSLDEFKTIFTHEANLISGDQIVNLEKIYKVKIDYDADNQCGQIKFNGRVFIVRSKDQSQSDSLTVEDWKQVAAQLTSMLTKNNLLNDGFTGATINNRGITPLSNPKIIHHIKLDKNQDTTQDFEDLCHFVAQKILKNPKKIERPFTP